jgi:hypothetical protein
MSECTIVVGIDAATIEQLKLTYKTWKLVRPFLWDWPWIIFYDPRSLELKDIGELRRTLDVKDIQFIPWYDNHYHSQREKMVTGHVFVPAEHCQTEWFCKIDTDAIAESNKAIWPKQEWFMPDEHGQYNVMIASGWGYTRAKGGGPLNDDVRRWWEVLESFGDKVFKTPRIDIEGKIKPHPKGDKLKIHRLASWVCFQRTGWVREMAKLFAQYFPHHTLPVPSHDTPLWHAALRSGARFTSDKMTRYGWCNRLSMSSIRQTVNEVENNFRSESKITINTGE